MEADPPQDVTPELFRRWRDARRGEVEAELVSNPYWSWLIRSDVNTWSANKHFGGPSSFGGNAAWSAQRFGQSTTKLPDGRTLRIAGEHEDYYDPDFFIYNDVIIVGASGGITIRAYPENVFPPTDFHSATLIGDEVVLVGNLGYPSQRMVGETQVLRLDLERWTVRAQPSTGPCPGWIHRHDAALSEDGRSVVLTRGLVHADDGPLLENFDDWRLHLDSWTWERLTQRPWPVFVVKRADGRRTELWEMRQALWHADYDDGSIGVPEGVDYPMPEDRAALEALYQPPIAHQNTPQGDDEFDVYRVVIEGVTVRYKEGSFDVTMTVEGELPESTLGVLVRDLVDKLRRATGAEFVSERLRPTG